MLLLCLLIDFRHLEVHGDSEAHVRRVARSKPASAVATVNDDGSGRQVGAANSGSIADLAPHRTSCLITPPPPQQGGEARPGAEEQARTNRQAEGDMIMIVSRGMAGGSLGGCCPLVLVGVLVQRGTQDDGPAPFPQEDVHHLPVTRRREDREAIQLQGGGRIERPVV